MKMHTTEQLNALSRAIHEQQIKWWVDLETLKPIKRDSREAMMLVVTELAEAAEGVRKDLMDDKLPHRKMKEVEMADAYIRLLDFAGGYDIELERIGGAMKVDPNKLAGILIIVRSVSAWLTVAMPSTVVSEALFLIQCYCIHHDLDLDGALIEKVAYNETREDHSREHRMASGGKKI